MRRKLILRGRVQQVGLRIKLQSLARGLGVSGSCRNLTDLSVEVWLGGKPQQVEALVSTLGEWRSGGDLLPDIAEIETLVENDEEFEWPDWVSEEAFHIFYGEGLTEFERSQAERSEMMVFGGRQIIGELRDLGQKLDQVGETVDTGRRENQTNFSAVIGAIEGRPPADRVEADIRDLQNRVSNLEDQMHEDQATSGH